MTPKYISLVAKYFVQTKAALVVEYFVIKNHLTGHLFQNHYPNLELLSLNICSGNYRLTLGTFYPPPPKFYARNILIIYATPPSNWTPPVLTTLSC